MASKGPTELELSILAGYKHPAKSLQALRKDILTITQLSSSLKSYRLKAKDEMVHLKRAINLVTILTNVFEKPTIEYAVYAIMPKEFWTEASTLLYAMKVSESTKWLDTPLLNRIQEARVIR